VRAMLDTPDAAAGEAVLLMLALGGAARHRLTSHSPHHLLTPHLPLSRFVTEIT